MGASYFIGQEANVQEPFASLKDGEGLYKLALYPIYATKSGFEARAFLAARVQLFAHIDAPVYNVIVGEVKREYADNIAAAQR